MTKTNILQKFFFGVLLFALFVYWGCDKDSDIPNIDTNTDIDTVTVNNTDTAIVDNSGALVTDSLLGTHIGICYHYGKNLSTGQEYWDTSFNSTLTFTKHDDIWTDVSGCGGFNFLKLPDLIDTVYNNYGYVGNQSHYFEITINNIDKTIVTKSVVTAPGGAPYFERYDGKWNF